MTGYALEGVLGGGFRESLCGLAVDGSGRVVAAGDSEIRVFEPGGALARKWPAEKPAHAVAVAADGRVYVGEPGQIEVFDAEGKPLGVLRDGRRLALPTAVAVHDGFVIAGDVATRAVHRFRADGAFVDSIGQDAGAAGFMIPNAHMDLAVDGAGVIHAANPGKHRVERYTLEGELLGRFGRFTGRNPEGFSGCCNPTNLALLESGDVVVTVKAPPGVRIYGQDGTLREAFGLADFDPACRNMDVAVGGGRIYVADPVRLQVCVFARRDP